MSNKDKQRKADKVECIARRMKELRGNEETLLGLLDEVKLDMILLSLGLSVTVLVEDLL